jgi:lysylphosphatidylglycerol synthetase-like protein (DUF2156 family)
MLNAVRMSGNRPIAITIISLLYILGGVALILFAIFGGSIANAIVGQPSTLPATGSNSTVSGRIQSQLQSQLQGIVVVVQTVAVIAGLVNVVVGYGLWKGKKWAWWIALILGVIGLIYVLYSLLFLLQLSATGLISFIIGLIIIYALLRKDSKAFFAPATAAA